MNIYKTDRLCPAVHFWTQLHLDLLWGCCQVAPRSATAWSRRFPTLLRDKGPGACMVQIAPQPKMQWGTQHCARGWGRPWGQHDHRKSRAALSHPQVKSFPPILRLKTRRFRCHQTQLHPESPECWEESPLWADICAGPGGACCSSFLYFQDGSARCPRKPSTGKGGECRWAGHTALSTCDPMARWAVGDALQAGDPFPSTQGAWRVRHLVVWPLQRASTALSSCPQGSRRQGPQSPQEGRREAPL